MLRFTILLLLITGFSHAASTKASFDQAAQTILDKHYQQYRELEYFSGATLSIYIPNENIKNYYAGRVSHQVDSPKVDVNSLFEIGSISKSFTAVVILQLEKEKYLNLNQTLKEWLPIYSKWSHISLKQLLNMTSGLPNYSDAPLWNAAAYQQPHYSWTNEELIDFVYPNGSFSPPLKTDFFYTNTGYVLLDLIVQKAMQYPFQAEMIRSAIKKAHLTNTFYPLPQLEDAVKIRLVSGYNYNQYDNPSLVGKEIYHNLSWAGAAGAIISNSEDIIKWVKAIFIQNDVLDEKQKAKLTQLVSQKTGKPIKLTSKEDPRGFGLGVVEAYDANLGRYWFYEGETLGFRALYFYSPCSGIIISSIFNSATNEENDHAGDLMKGVYALVLKAYPTLKNKYC